MILSTLGERGREREGLPRETTLRGPGLNGAIGEAALHEWAALFMEGREDHKCKHKNPRGAYILCALSGSYARDLGRHDRVLKSHDRVLRGDARILRAQARVLSCTRGGGQARIVQTGIRFLGT